MIYVTSDIHGQYDSFKKLLEKINFNDNDTLYILGDIIDRGPQIIEIIREVISTPNIVMVLGNHEDMFLNYYDSKDIGDRILWFRNGGNITYSALKSISENEVKDIVKYFKSLPIERNIEVNGNRFQLVHGAFVSDRKKEQLIDSAYRHRIIWGRIRVNDRGPEDRIVIFGHTPTGNYTGDYENQKIWKKNNLIGIDCGMAYGEIYPEYATLGCLCLDNMQEYYISK